MPFTDGARGHTPYKLYYCRKFAKVSGNIKQTWALINELRGKAKTSIKASFKIQKKSKFRKSQNLFFSKLYS